MSTADLGLSQLKERISEGKHAIAEWDICKGLGAGRTALPPKKVDAPVASLVFYN
jgi:hypothetical protein